jgi:thymidylate kinase
LLLAIFGPDGVGKSSVMSAVTSAIAPLFEHHRTMRWRPQLIRSRIAKEAHKFRLPHSAGTHRLPLSMAKLAGAFLDFYLDHATLTRNQLRGCSLITWDRYFHDLVVDTKRYRYDGPAWYPEFLLRCFPIPDRFLGIVLDADEEAILRRKAELPLEEIRRQRRAYRQLAALPRTTIVKNDGPLENTITQVLRIFVDGMADSLDPLLPALLNSRSSDVYADAA